VLENRNITRIAFFVALALMLTACGVATNIKRSRSGASLKSDPDYGDAANWNTSGSSDCRVAWLANNKHDLEDLGRLRSLLPRPQIDHLEGPGPGRIDSEVKNLMSRRTGHPAVERERGLPDLPGEPASNRLRLPGVSGPRSSRQRNLERIAAIERKLAPIVVLRNKNHARTRLTWYRQRDRNQKQQQM